MNDTCEIEYEFQILDYVQSLLHLVFSLLDLCVYTLYSNTGRNPKAIAMLQRIENMIFDGPSRGGIKYLQIPDYKAAIGLRKSVLQQMQIEFQKVPPITLHISNSELMASNWTFSREVLIAGTCDRRERELVAAIISKINKCPFCIEVHTSMLYGAGDQSGLDIIVDGKTSDQRKTSIAEWAGATLTPDASILKNAPFSESDRPFFVGTALAFHYTNRMVNIFLEDSPLPVSFSTKWLQILSGRLLGFMVGRRIVSVKAEPGKSVYHDADATLPDEFSWAKGNEHIAGAVAAFAKTAEAAGEQTLSPEVRKIVLKVVEDWNGEHMPMDRSWIDLPLAKLPKEDRPSAELALLASLAPYRVSDSLVSSFRQKKPNDIDLVNATSWGAFIAMRRISTWIDTGRI